MNGFNDIAILYKGEEKYLPADNFLIVLADIEEIITFDELNNFLAASVLKKRGIKLGKITSAYLRLLTLSGFTAPHPITLSKQLTSGEVMEDAVTSLTNLFKQLMNDESQGEQPEKKPETQDQASS